MLEKFFNHFRLTWRLLNDKQVNILLKLFLIVVPFVYTLFPLPDDLLPVIGLLDDALFMGLCSMIFIALCPPAVVTEHKLKIEGKSEESAISLDDYRYPSENRDLALGFAITFLVLIFSGYLGGLVGTLLFGLGYLSAAVMRSQMLGNGVQVTEHQLSHLYEPFQVAQSHLSPLKVDLVVTQNPAMNAFTFGYQEPYTVVLTSGLVERLSTEEIQAVIGHELGHIHFGHVRLTSIMMGLGGLPRLLFYKWRRSGEYSADAVALRVSGGDPHPMVSSLLKISSGMTDMHLDVESFLQQSDKMAGAVSSISELTSTHPFVNKRIKQLMEQKNSLEHREV